MEKKNKNYSNYIRLLWVLALMPIIGLAFIFSWIIFLGDLPSLEELENPKSNLASEIISADQKILGKYYIENRTNVEFKNLSPHLVKALVATEDARFYTHSGVDLRALGRAVSGVVLGKESSGGGSTITQQLAKMLFPREELKGFEIVFRKFKEWVIAVKLEKNYTKDEIITMYLNKFDFVNNAVGIKTASKVYFDSSPDSLKIEQAAMLVGMAKNPALFNPVRRPEQTKERRNVVLAQMAKYGYLEKAKYDSLKNLPLNLKFQLEDHNQGQATYFREYLRDELKKWCKENIKPDGTPYDIYKDGLKIYTTINSRMQRHAEEAVSEWLPQLQNQFFKHWKGVKNAPFYNMTPDEIEALLVSSMKRSERYRVLKAQGLSFDEIKENFNKPVKMTVFSWKGEIDTTMTPKDSMVYYKQFLQTGLMAMEPQTGFVRAWVGGINYKHFKYDHVKVGKRQVGSTFKPFVYALAMQEKWSPCYQVPNIPITFNLPEGGTWSPQNSDAEYGGMMTLKKGLALSVNTITAYVLKQFGPHAAVEMARKLGITSPMEPVPSICLGTPDISLYEMVGANAAFANKGVWTQPLYITRIEDKNGNIIQEFVPRRVEALSEQTAYLTLNLMKGVVEGYGTGVRLRYRYKVPGAIAGKTGTTQNNSDGWFIGLTPDLVSGVWTGCEDRSVHFRSTDLGQGAHMALPIWGIFMNKVYSDPQLKLSQDDFEKPEGDLGVELDCSKYKSTESDAGEFDGTDNQWDQ